MPAQRPLTAVATSPDGRWIAVGEPDGSITLRTGDGGTHVRTLVAHGRGVGALVALLPWILSEASPERTAAAGALSALLVRAAGDAGLPRRARSRAVALLGNQTRFDFDASVFAAAEQRARDALQVG